jgi:TadE-like protein
MHARIRKIRSQRRCRRLLALQRFRRDESGIHLVEVAIVLPIFLMLFAATAEFGRFFYEYTTLAKATRVGARYLTTAQVIPAEDATAKNIIVYGNPSGSGDPILPGLSPTNVVISRQGGVPVLPETVRVQIQNYRHQPIFDLGQMLNVTSLSLNIDVKPSVTMRYLLTQPPPIE